MSAKIGRPTKPIDKKQLERLMQMYATKQQVATFFDCSDTHVENEIERLFGCSFLALRERAIDGQKRKIYGWALKYASRGNENLIKFLMKNIHKFTDKQDIGEQGNQTFELKYKIEKRVSTETVERDVSPEEKKPNDD